MELISNKQSGIENLSIQVLLTRLNDQKSQVERSGLYGGCGNSIIPIEETISLNTIALWVRHYCAIIG